MLATVFLIIFGLVGTFFFWSAIFSKNLDYKKIALPIGIGCGVFVVLISLFSVVYKVDDGHVGVIRIFGQYQEDTLAPSGFQIKWPWEELITIDTRVKSHTFSGDEDEAISGPITAQAKGGGNLTIEHTVQISINPTEADELLREVGNDWFKIIVLPSIRSCTRDASVNLTLEEAYTTARQTLGTNTLDCTSEDVSPFGINVLDVKIRDVDPGPKVKTAIEDKQAAEQEVERARIDFEKAEVAKATQELEALATSNSEQIIACGGTIVGEDEHGIPIIEATLDADGECDDQFSQNYLTYIWLTQTLPSINGVVITDPQFDGQLFVNPATGGVVAGVDG